MFNPQDFIKLSKELLEYETHYREALIRTIISRAYYSSFLSAREELKNQLKNTALEVLYEEISEEPEIHQAVYDILKTLDPVNADLLGKLRKKRNQADYNLQIPKSLKEAEDCIMDAEMSQKQLSSIVQKISPEKILEIEEKIRPIVRSVLERKTKTSRQGTKPPSTPYI